MDETKAVYTRMAVGGVLKGGAVIVGTFLFVDSICCRCIRNCYQRYN